MGVGLLPLAFFVVLTFVVFAGLGRFYLNSGVLVLFRAFFPSWRFFDDIAYRPRLELRVGQGEWKNALVPEPRRPGSLFVNERHNLFLAMESLLQRFADDHDERDGEAMEETVSARILRRHCLAQIPASAASAEFRVVLVGVGEDRGRRQSLYSEVILEPAGGGDARI